MAWKSQSTSQRMSVDAEVNVDLKDFDEAQLLQALIDADLLSKTEAEAIRERGKRKEKNEKIGNLYPPVDEDELAVALELARRKQRGETLYRLERALGRDWYGLLAEEVA